MSKTPEELTWDWKAGKLEYGRYWVKNKVWEKPFIDRWRPNFSWEISCKDAIEQILAPVPTYDEYKAMQAELAEHRHYCCCDENEVLRLKLAEMEELLKQCIPAAEFAKDYGLVSMINAALNETQANSVADIKIQESEEK